MKKGGNNCIMISRSVKCSDCGELLENENENCPKCGSDKKTFQIGVRDGIEIHEQIKGKVKSQAINKPLREFIYGDEKYRKQDKWVDKTRIIDRENNEYTEIVKYKETGEIIHECKEPLTDHFNHGSAKKSQSENK
jgi:Zn ribbon nucleic-acid-binding protein